MVDKDMCEINALRKVFSESDILLCWYHVMQVRIYTNVYYSVYLINVRKLFHVTVFRLSSVGLQRQTLESVDHQISMLGQKLFLSSKR